MEDTARHQRWRIRVGGVVQGVGYRPFVYKLALTHRLDGWVLNDPEGVLTEVQGDPDALRRFAEGLRTEAPPQARVQDISVTPQPGLETGFDGFVIRKSVHAGRRVAIVPADAFVCADCLEELRDPSDRRYAYPFINCTNCGPRYSIVRGLPYDRAQTTMSAFTMCAPCAAEYGDPLDRRYHAQPNACPDCGPSLMCADREGAVLRGAAALERSAEVLAGGGIVAVKSVGGYHLAVEARDAEAVRRLRARKRRDSKPFAVMARDLAEVARFADPTPGEAGLLGSPARPIVLVRKRPGGLPEEIAPRNPNLGVMLPSAPHHHLLTDRPGLGALVMTSGNVSGHPIAFRDEDALGRLFEIADLILYHDREIQVRVDDSVVRHTVHPELEEPVTTFLRRSRGYAPYPVEVGTELAPLAGYGAELKTTVALTHGTRVYLSQHIGDLKNDETFESHRQTMAHLARLHEVTPGHAAVDLHPQFRSARVAIEEYGREPGRVLRVQHHHAHMASCMAEHRLSGSVLGVVFDGFGYGEDGTVWGGELLLGGYREARRVARLRPMPLIGGDRAVKEPIRTGFALALDALGDPEAALAAFPALRGLRAEELRVYTTMARRGVNSPAASSMGRLFDAVAALLDVCVLAEYEAQGPIELEGLLGRDLAMSPQDECYRFAVDETGGLPEIDPRPVVRALAADVAAGVPVAEAGRRFHTGVVHAVVERCAAVRAAKGEAAGRVVLSGGVFANEFLLVNCMIELRRAGFATYCHQQVPAGDGGIALGQVMVANARLAAMREEAR
ncbi:carbamoyltransferase HypF [Sphaerisporangium sp. NPDC088356]|uniref:carbamoyltransferase HypF n=1 Tax=Sphaerisporangium sp. NPDC088356 TaxID=3154871 RepID=UPI00341249B5